jgi:hypothetical protein
MYNLNSVLIESAVETITSEETITKLVLTTFSRVGTGSCLVEVFNSDRVLERRVNALVEGQTVRVVGRVQFSEDGTCGVIVADNIEPHPPRKHISI